MFKFRKISYKFSFLVVDFFGFYDFKVCKVDSRGFRY